MIGIDTCAVIDLFKGDKQIISLLSDISEKVCITYINYLELIFGLDIENIKHKSEEEFYDHIMENYTVYNLDIESCKKARELFFLLKKKGNTIDDMDYAIAGILLSNGVNKIITKNKKHFENIPGVKVLSY